MEFSQEEILKHFQEIWGYEKFRHPQGEIVNTLLQHKDALIIIPTGAGKSICFQLPALLKEGLTLVISPLIALIENQVQELLNRQLPAGILHSEISKYEGKKTLQKIQNQQLRLLYLSPENLLSSPVFSVLCLPEIKINGIILDEAHCLAQWGDTFRPNYRKLGIIRPTLLKHKPPNTKIAIAAFTATADPETQKIIIDTLKLNQPEKFLINPYRNNLHLKVKNIWTPRGRKKQLLNFIKSKKYSSGLIYVRTRKESESLANYLQDLGYQNAAYHAGLSGNQRRKIEQDWLIGKIKFVVSTSAFGMGINKADVRWICHYQPPQLLSEYIQEIGRGGRDGKVSDALMLISEPTGFLNPEDKNRREFFQHKIENEYRKALEIAKKISFTDNIENVSKKYDNCQLYLAIFHSAKQLKWLDPFTYQKNAQIDVKAVQNLIIRQRKLNTQMTNFLTTKSCRWQFLLSAFGFNSNNNFKCGNCDRCQKSK
jgi:ATP-dependent DNA helicase RecQ